MGPGWPIKLRQATPEVGLLENRLITIIYGVEIMSDRTCIPSKWSLCERLRQKLFDLLFMYDLGEGISRDMIDVGGTEPCSLLQRSLLVPVQRTRGTSLDGAVFHLRQSRSLARHMSKPRCSKVPPKGDKHKIPRGNDETGIPDTTEYLHLDICQGVR
jgi:hypothetical protein